MSRFKSYVGLVKPIEGKLPLVHTTDAYALRDMLEAGAIFPQDCPVFAPDRLIYLFYGRPAYRLNDSAEAASLLSYAPITLIIDTPATLSIKRIFPFDSGAFRKGLYKGALHKRMRLGDFALEPQLESAQKLIGLFFGDMKGYFDGKVIPGISLPPLEFEIASYYNIAGDTLRNTYDDRVSAIEVQVDSQIDLLANVKAAVVPAPFLDDRSFLEHTASLGVRPLPYDLTGRFRANEHMGQIYAIIRDYFQAENLL